MTERKKPSGVSGLRRGMAAGVATLPVRPDETAVLPESAGVKANDMRPVRPVKPVRVTLDLDPAVHLFLREFATAAGVKASPVLRALLAELRADPKLADRVRGRVYSG